MYYNIKFIIIFRDTTDIGVDGVRAGGVCPPRKDIGRREERAGRVKNSYVIISDGA